mgnify:CR=1 FL=1
MSQELLAILEQIEREKGIKKEILVQAVESALLSAANCSLAITTTPNTFEVSSPSLPLDKLHNKILPSFMISSKLMVDFSCSKRRTSGHNKPILNINK